MMCFPRTALLVFSLIITACVAHPHSSDLGPNVDTALTTTIRFPVGSAELDSSACADLERLLRQARHAEEKHERIVTVTIVAWADQAIANGEAAPQRLADRRNEAVLSFFDTRVPGLQHRAVNMAKPASKFENVLSTVDAQMKTSLRQVDPKSYGSKAVVLLQAK